MEWSVLNNSIDSYLAQSQSVSQTNFDLVYFDIQNTIRNLNKINNLNDLLSLVSAYSKCFHRNQNRILISCLNYLRTKFGDSTINYLIESLIPTCYLPYNDYNYTEHEYTTRIVSGFDDIFPELSLVKREAYIKKGYILTY